MLRKTSGGAPESTFGQFLNRQGDERDEEHDEDGDNTPLDPIHDRDSHRAASRVPRVGDREIPVVVACDSLVAKGTKVKQAPHEELYRQHDKQVVDVKARVCVVE